MRREMVSLLYLFILFTKEKKSVNPHMRPHTAYVVCDVLLQAY
jgi:hypothetical protein